MGRHRHVVNVRADGIAVVLGPLLGDARITAAALVDVDSGMVLDAWSAADPSAGSAEVPDLELLGAQHAEVVRCALALLRSWPRAGGQELGGQELGAPGSDPHGADTCEVVLGTDGGQQHLLRTVPDPHGDRLALAVVVDGPARVLDRVRRRLRSISVDALTAGPSMTRRPVLGGWSFAMPAPDVPARPALPPGAVPPGTVSSGTVRPASATIRIPVVPLAPASVPAPAPSRPYPAWVEAPPALTRLDAASDRAVPHARSALSTASDPPSAPDGRRPEDRQPAAVPPRSPSPPSALPAPAPRRSRQD